MKCECGSPKKKNVEACDRCMYLDGRDNGRKSGASMVISELRRRSYATTAELARGVGMSHRQVLRICQALARIGRTRSSQAHSKGFTETEWQLSMERAS